MRTFFLILSMLNLLGIIPCFVVFIVMAARKKKKAIWGFMALGCVVGTILFGMKIGRASCRERVCLYV